MRQLDGLTFWFLVQDTVKISLCNTHKTISRHLRRFFDMDSYAAEKTRITMNKMSQTGT